MSLIAASDVRARIQGLTADDDAELGELIAAADALAAQFLMLPLPSGAAAPTLSEASYVDYLDGPDREDRTRIMLRMRPVASVDEIRDDPDREYGSDTDVDTDDVELDGEGGYVYLKATSTHAWSRGRRAIRVTYTAGWDDDAPPADLEEALLRIVAALWNRRHVPGLPNAAEVVQVDPLADARVYLAPHRLWERAAGAP